MVGVDANEQRRRVTCGAFEHVPSVPGTKVKVKPGPFGCGLGEMLVEAFELLARDEVHGVSPEGIPRILPRAG
jgi:hypothetical protein